MSRRGPRETLATGIYRDALGLEAVARAAGRAKWQRFPRGTTVSTIRAWQEGTRTAFRKAAATRAATFRSGTLAGDIAAYLATLPERQRRERDSEYLAWLTPALRDRRRSSLTLEQLRTQVSAWVDAGVAASTINHYRRALIALYEAIDGEDPPVLPRRLKRQREAEGPIRSHDMAVLDAILREMDTHPYHGERRALRSRPRAWLRLLLWTGMSPASLCRVSAHDVDLEARELRLPPRRKGRGAPPLTVPLWEPQGVDAARDWLRAFGWFPMATERLDDALQRAVRAYRRRHPSVALPPKIRLTDLRHSFLTMVARRTRDPRVVQWYGQHLDIQTSMRYIRAAIPDIAREALAVPRSVPRGSPDEGGRPWTPADRPARRQP